MDVSDLFEFLDFDIDIPGIAAHENSSLSWRDWETIGHDDKATTKTSPGASFGIMNSSESNLEYCLDSINAANNVASVLSEYFPHANAKTIQSAVSKAIEALDSSQPRQPTASFDGRYVSRELVSIPSNRVELPTGAVEATWQWPLNSLFV